MLGAKAPVMLTSRADNDRARLASCALAQLYGYWRREGRAFSDEPTVAKAAEQRIWISVILTLNAGSSSLKFAAFALVKGGEPIRSLRAKSRASARPLRAASRRPRARRAAQVRRVGPRVDHDAAMGAILEWLKEAGYDSSVAAVGHRIVHGGPDYSEPDLIDEP